MLQVIPGHSSMTQTERYGRISQHSVAEQFARLAESLGKLDGTPRVASSELGANEKPASSRQRALVGWHRYRESNPGLMAENHFPDFFAARP